MNEWKKNFSLVVVVVSWAENRNYFLNFFFIIISSIYVCCRNYYFLGWYLHNIFSYNMLSSLYKYNIIACPPLSPASIVVRIRLIMPTFLHLIEEKK